MDGYKNGARSTKNQRRDCVSLIHAFPATAQFDELKWGGRLMESMCPPSTMSRPSHTSGCVYNVCNVYVNLCVKAM